MTHVQESVIYILGLPNNIFIIWVKLAVMETKAIYMIVIKLMTIFTTVIIINLMLK